jgi:hypothetical protein
MDFETALIAAVLTALHLAAAFYAYREYRLGSKANVEEAAATASGDDQISDMQGESPS